MPEVSANGDLSWTNDKGLPNPQTVNIKGPRGSQGPPGTDGKDGVDAPQIDDTQITTTNPWSSKKIVDMMCPPFTASGAIVQCTPVENYPLDVKVEITPTQEGSGEPYPAGGGPNLLDISQCTPTVGKPYGVTITIDGDIIKVSGVPSSEVTEESNYSFAVAVCAQTELRGKGYKVTPFAIKGTVSSAWGLRTEDESSLAISAKLTPGVNADIQLRLMVSKDTPTTYAPYTNIRPISGRDSVKVTRCGENLLDGSKWTTKTNAGVTYEPTGDGGIYCHGTATANSDSPTIDIRLRPGTYISNLSSAKYPWLASSNYVVAKPNGSYLWLAAGVRFTVAEVSVGKYFYFAVKAGETIDEIVYPMIVPGTTAPATYVPYTGQTTTLTLPSTIYGAEISANGEGQETWKLLTLTGEEQWNYESNAYFVGHYVLNNVPVATDGKCSHFIYHYNYGGDCIFCRGNSVYTGPKLTAKYTDVDAWKSYLAAQYAAGTPVQIAYKLADPIPFTATGGAPVPALPGINTLYADAGITTVQGRHMQTTINGGNAYNE